MLLFAACSSSDAPQPELPEKPEFETIITVGAVPDSVKVETSTNINFTVIQKEHTEDFKIEVDTIVPNYYLFEGNSCYEINGEITCTPIYQYQRFGAAEIKINGKDLTEITTISANQENTIYFSNPTAVGEYTITLRITDKNKKVTTKEIIVKAYSPAIELKFYNYFAGYDEENYYDFLNNQFTHDSQELKGLETDTIYTQEKPKPGFPGEWTEPGQGVICSVFQEGGQAMQYVNDTYNYLVSENRYLSTTHWAHRIDGKDSWRVGELFKQGFHGIMFETTTLSGVGIMHYTIRVVDKWGKCFFATLPYQCFSRNATIPDWCTPSENDWWYHKINN